MDNKLIVARLQSLRGQRTNIEAKWGDIDRYIAPLEQGAFAQKADEENSKDWSCEEVWDSTAPIGAERLASMFYSGFISGRWLGAVFDGASGAKLNQIPAAKAWLEQVIDRMYEAIMSSNFPVAFAAYCRSWVNYGNGCLTKSLSGLGASWEGFDFGCTPVKELFFEEDWQGRPYRTFRPLQWTAVQIVSKFRNEDGTGPHPSIPEAIVKEAGAADASAGKHEIVYAVYRRDGVKPMAWNEKARAAALRPYGEKYVLSQGAVTLGEEGGRYEIDAYIGRYSTSPSSQWGYGPSLLALPTVKLLNTLLEQVYVSGAKALDPMTIATERGLIGDLNNVPGGLTFVRSLDDIDVLESKARFDVSDMLIEQLRHMIRKLYREDDVTLKESPQMSATEATIRDDRLNRLFGPQVRQTQFDVLAPVVNGVFNDMLREGQLPEVPDEVLQNSPVIRIKFFGQFMRALRTDEVAAIERLASAHSAMIKMQVPRTKYAIKGDQILRDMAERLGTPALEMNSEEEITRLEEQERELAMAQAQAEIAKMAGEANRAQAGADQMMREGMNGA